MLTNNVILKLRDWFNQSRSSYYYYQVKAKPISDSTKAIAKSRKKISLETGCTCGRRELKHLLNADGLKICHRTTTLVKKSTIEETRPIKLSIGIVHKKVDNLLQSEFNQPTSNTHWVGDITYIKTCQD